MRERESPRPRAISAIRSASNVVHPPAAPAPPLPLSCPLPQVTVTQPDQVLHSSASAQEKQMIFVPVPSFVRSPPICHTDLLPLLLLIPSSLRPIGLMLPRMQSVTSFPLDTKTNYSAPASSSSSSWAPSCMSASVVRLCFRFHAYLHFCVATATIQCCHVRTRL